MFLLILAAIVSGDVVKINTVNTEKSIMLMMGGAPQTFTVDQYGRMTWMENPSTTNIVLLIGDDEYDLKTSRTGAGYNGCNYNFDIYSDDEMYQNSGMECTKVFEKAPGAIELINDVGKPVYPAFDLGWGFSSDSVQGWLGADMIAVYTSQNPYLNAIGAKEGTQIQVGYFDQSNYKSCGQVTVGEEFIMMLSECTDAETAVGNCKVATGWDKSNDCGGGYWELAQWGCCDQVCCPRESSVGAWLYGDTSGTDGGKRTETSWSDKVVAEYNALSSSDRQWVDQNCGAGILEEPRSRIGVHTFLDCKSRATRAGASGTFVYYDGDCYLYKEHHSADNVKYKHHRPQGQEHWMYCSASTHGTEEETAVAGCPIFRCNLHCPNGFEVDANGCEVCWCKRPDVEKAVGNCQFATGWDKSNDCGGGYWELTQWGCCDQVCCPRGAEKSVGLLSFQTSTLESSSADSWAVYGFAVIGTCALVQQAYKMVVKKNRETTPLYQEV